ncbi:MAG: DUF2752 domain-containing protein [Flavipsychrobacter sp.]
MASVGRFYLLTTSLLIGGWIWLLYNLYNSHITDGHTLCFIKNVTGYPCPACGTTNSVEAILSGSYQRALSVNPLGYIALLALVLLPVIIGIDLMSGKRMVYSMYTNFDKTMKQRPILLFIIFLLLLINWIWNLYKM